MTLKDLITQLQSSNKTYGTISKDARYLSVADEYRTNPLSHTAGGVEVCIQFKCGHVLGYDKVKNPDGYIAAVLARRNGGRQLKPHEAEEQIESITINNQEYYPNGSRKNLPWQN